MHEVVDLTRSLVAIPSHEDETEAGAFIRDWLVDHTDASVDRDDAGNVFARKGDGDRSIALVGHHDVVPPADGQLTDDGSVRTAVIDDRLSGRGSADMKGAVAAMLLAFRDAIPELELVVASFVGEETGGIGARHAVDHGFAPTYAVVGEGSAGYATPGILDVVIAHRGRRGSTVTATGTACHASNPDEGVNAIYRATKAIDRLRGMPLPEHELAGEAMAATLTVTQIEAGVAMNVVPDRCTLTVDERTLPAGRMPIGEELADLEGIDWSVDQDWPPMECSDRSFAEQVRTAFSDVQDSEASFVTKPHATDASWLATAGTATVVVGPAEQGQAHTTDESVSIDRLRAAKEGYQAVAESAFVD